MTYYKKGTWRAICDLCAFEFKSDELRKNWKGLFVCSRDYETRQPLDFIRARHEDTTVPWTRPESADDYVEVCYMWEESAYADLATADCATADTSTPSYSYLVSLRDGNG